MMIKSIFAAFNGLLLLQLVASQAKTAWQAGGVGMGLGMPPMQDFNEHQINMAMVGVHQATTEQQAIKAAVAVFHPTLDMADAVKGALETKIQQLRIPPGWSAPIPPPLPFGFDVMNLIMSEYYKAQIGAPGAVTIAPAPMVPPVGRPRRPRRPQGPPTSIRRGPTAPSPAAIRQGNSGVFQYPPVSNAWRSPAPVQQPQQNSWQSPPPPQPSWQQAPPQSQPSWQQAPSQSQSSWQQAPPSSQWQQPLSSSQWSQPQPSRQSSFSNDPTSFSLPPSSSFSNGPSQFANGWEQNYFGSTNQVPSPPAADPAPSPSSVPDFTPLASSMAGWINPFYNPSSNPSAWR